MVNAQHLTFVIHAAAKLSWADFQAAWMILSGKFYLKVEKMATRNGFVVFHWTFIFKSVQKSGGSRISRMKYTGTRTKSGIHIYQQECIPVGCVPSAAVAIGGGGCLPGGCLPGGCLPGGGGCLADTTPLNRMTDVCKRKTPSPKVKLKYGISFPNTLEDSLM